MEAILVPLARRNSSTGNALVSPPLALCRTRTTQFIALYCKLYYIFVISPFKRESPPLKVRVDVSPFSWRRHITARSGSSVLSHFSSRNSCPGRTIVPLLLTHGAPTAPQAVAEKYYRDPRDRLAAAARAAPSWAGLREIWFKAEEHEGDGLEEEKALALQVGQRVWRERFRGFSFVASRAGRGQRARQGRSYITPPLLRRGWCGCWRSEWFTLAWLSRLRATLLLI